MMHSESVEETVAPPGSIDESSTLPGSVTDPKTGRPTKEIILGESGVHSMPQESRADEDQASFNINSMAKTLVKRRIVRRAADGRAELAIITTEEDIPVHRCPEEGRQEVQIQQPDDIPEVIQAAREACSDKRIPMARIRTLGGIRSRGNTKEDANLHHDRDTLVFLDNIQYCEASLTTRFQKHTEHIYVHPASVPGNSQVCILRSLPSEILEKIFYFSMLIETTRWNKRSSQSCPFYGYPARARTDISISGMERRDSCLSPNPVRVPAAAVYDVPGITPYAPNMEIAMIPEARLYLIALSVRIKTSPFVVRPWRLVDETRFPSDWEIFYINFEKDVSPFVRKRVREVIVVSPDSKREMEAYDPVDRCSGWLQNFADMSQKGRTEIGGCIASLVSSKYDTKTRGRSCDEEDQPGLYSSERLHLQSINEEARQSIRGGVVSAPDLYSGRSSYCKTFPRSEKLVIQLEGINEYYRWITGSDGTSLRHSIQAMIRQMNKVEGIGIRKLQVRKFDYFLNSDLQHEFDRAKRLGTFYVARSPWLQRDTLDLRETIGYPRLEYFVLTTPNGYFKEGFGFIETYTINDSTNPLYGNTPMATTL